MSAEHAREARQVGVHGEHAAVIVAEHAHAVAPQLRCRPGGIDPRPDPFPDRILRQIARDDIVTQSEPVEHAGHLGHRAGLAVGEPLAGHPSPVAHRVEPVVVDSRLGLQIQHDDRNAQPLYDGQYGRRKRIRRYVEEDQFRTVLAQQLRRRLGFGRLVDHPGVDNLGSRFGEPIGYPAAVPLQTSQQALELGPISVQSYSEKSYLHRFVIF